MCADDIQVYMKSPFTNIDNCIWILSEELNRISFWASDNTLLINSRKQAIVLSCRNVDVLDFIKGLPEVNETDVHTFVVLFTFL